MSRTLMWLAAAAVLALLPAAAAAQQRDTTQQQDTTLTREQRIRQRLRSLSPLISPDTMPADSAAADSIAAADSLDSTPGSQFDPNATGREAGTGLSAANRDSTMLELLRLSGYVGTEYSGDTATYVAADERLVLQGAAEVVRDGQRITADTSLVYYDRLAYACAYGNPVVSGGGADSPIRSDSLCYDVDHDVGVALGAQTEVSEGAVWYVSGDLVTVGERVYSHDAIFTDCSEEEPHYHFGAGSMKVLKNNVMVARDVTLKFGDVPVFWLPFFMQSLSQGRRSGILFPRFGINDIARNSSRYSRSIEDVGFYWAISDHLGAEVATDWKSDNYTALRGSFDYRFRRQFLNGGTTFRRFWQEGGGTTFTLANNTSWQPDERTTLSANVNYTSSASFIRERAVDPRELNRSIASSANLGRRFDWGSLSLGANRNQTISTGQVRMTLPSVNLTLSPITLFPALPGEGGPFSNMTWSASARANRQMTLIGDALAVQTQRNQNEFDGSVNSSFSFGRFSWGQGFSVRQHIADARTFDTDTGVVALPDSVDRTGSWNTSFSYQQPLIATSSLTPNLSMSGELARDPSDGSMVAGPTRMNFGASLNTDFFGFFPGFGPFEAIRHHISPTFSYTYSPKPTVTDLQRRVFGLAEDSAFSSPLSERNTLSIQFNQTFEAKFKEGRGPQQRASRVPLTKADSLAMLPEAERLMLPDSLRAMADSAIAENPALLEPPDTTSGPRRVDTAQKMTLFAISTGAFFYDFIRAREDGEGLRTTTLSNSLRSDLLPGFDLRITHDLFRTPERPDIDNGLGVVLPGPGPRREFAPHMTQMAFGFRIDSDSWITRLFGGGDDEAPADSTPPEPEPETGAESPVDELNTEEGLIGGRRREADPPPTTPVGTWSTSVNYSLSRPRDSLERQMVSGNLRFQPTINWSVSWNTGYSITEGKFSDHALTLTRRLHDFDASFDFYKAQNGNFTFQFRVNLRANPDLKFDYDQSDLPALDPRAR